MHICHTVVFFVDGCALHRIGMGQPKPLPGFLQPQRLDLMVTFQKQHILATRMFQPLVSGKRGALAGNLEDNNPLITQCFDDLPDIMSATRIDNQYLEIRARLVDAGTQRPLEESYILTDRYDNRKLYGTWHQIIILHTKLKNRTWHLLDF